MLSQLSSNAENMFVVCLGGSQVARLGAECAVAGDMGRLHRPGALLPGGPLHLLGHALALMLKAPP